MLCLRSCARDCVCEPCLHLLCFSEYFFSVFVFQARAAVTRSSSAAANVAGTYQQV